MGFSRDILKSNSDSASPCFRLLFTSKHSNSVFPTQTFVFVPSTRASIRVMSVLGIENVSGI